MVSRKVIAIIVILALIGIGYYFVYMNKPQEAPKTEEPKDADEQLAEYVKQYPDAVLTMVELKENKIVFANASGVHDVKFIRDVVFANNEIFDIDGFEFHIEIDEMLGKFYIYGLKNYDITDESTEQEYIEATENPFYLAYEGDIAYNAFSTNTITFTIQNPKFSEFEIDENEALPPEYYAPFYEKYNYYIWDDQSTNGQPKIFFVLAKQEFKIQFGKKIEFSGSDKTGNGKVNVNYYLPDAIWAGNAENDSKKIIATVKMDQDDDGKYDIEAYVDAETNMLLETPNPKAQKYPYSVKYDNAGSTSKDAKKNTVYGSYIWIEDNILSARLIEK